ncbi:Holliday junction DNA helicase subunit RuvA [Mycolicibacterium mucogenicum 261Sha1.1M5]|uniref:Holliday junction branch migration protein RuvA n=1 Tax=Leucobacter aridicollis TaxID=283878 RepID=UPI000EB125C8|nr:Holliday junction branch migration protein RuvA [Leucobacter aridicollis]MCS3428237.1 Holliday junction DNA helicase RuvA [Leucobacter aridicollis]RKQ94475.1 Holliday junction DNA helicase subunit RuvA [Mycolicibacterium mucogenicum 261Sha1.1M5]
MIASLRGEVLASGAGWVVLGVGGVGMRVEVPSGRMAQRTPGEQLFLHTSLVVREDSLTLYGFETEAELATFGFLIGVSGVGPRSGLGVLSELSPSEIVRAVTAEDDKPFRKVSGIGPKTAKLITVSLAGKLSALAIAEAGDEPAVVAPDEALTEAVTEGLQGLGWSEGEARQAVLDARDAGAEMTNAQLLRAALTLLQRGRR